MSKRVPRAQTPITKPSVFDDPAIRELIEILKESLKKPDFPTPFPIPLKVRQATRYTLSLAISRHDAETGTIILHSLVAADLWSFFDFLKEITAGDDGGYAPAPGLSTLELNICKQVEDDAEPAS